MAHLDVRTAFAERRSPLSGFAEAVAKAGDGPLAKAGRRARFTPCADCPAPDACRQDTRCATETPAHVRKSHNPLVDNARERLAADARQRAAARPRR
jgi:hypothetical protein